MPKTDTMTIVVELLPEKGATCSHPRMRLAVTRDEWEAMDDDEKNEHALDAMLELGKFRTNWYAD